MGAAGEEFVLDGDLTAHGITRPVRLRLEVNGFGGDPYGNQRCGFTATGSINRSDFGLMFNVPLEGGGVMSATASTSPSRSKGSCGNHQAIRPLSS